MKKIMLFLLLYCSITSLQAQPNLPKIIPASPEASALAKYINYPVNYGTGLVDISIPLYELKVGDLTVPISLSYHASGIKVKENCGWVGLGWTLNAEPSVSRSVKGMPDEKGYLHTEANDSKYYYKYIADGINEEEPDEFYYKLLDKSGGFYFHRNDMKSKYAGYEVVPHPYEPIKIGNSPNLTEFNIRDENGVFYEFTNIEQYRSGVSLITNQWKASKITSATTKDVIDFVYYPIETEYVSTISDITTIEDKFSDGRDGVYDGCVGYPGPYVTTLDDGGVNFYKVVAKASQAEDNDRLEKMWCSDLTKLEGGDNGQIFSEKLQLIWHENGYIHFIPDAKNKLQSIAVVDKYGKTIRTIRFSISLYPLADRYKLDAVEILDDKGVVVEKYSFDYYAGLPLKKAKLIDHWGYYTGQGMYPDISTVPNQSVIAATRNDEFSFQIGGTSREPSHNAMKSGTLKSITYPTGGRTDFEYEGNKYWDMQDSKIAESGGLRIAKIKDFNEANVLQSERYFKYGENEDGAGYTKHRVRLEDYMYEQNRHYATGEEAYPSFTYRLRTYLSNTIPDLFHSKGSPVVYDYVTEYRPGFGKTVYKYNNYFSGGSSLLDPKRHYSLEYRNDWQQGQLTEKTDYSYSNGKYTPVAKDAFSYSAFKPRQTNVGKVIKIDVGTYVERFDSSFDRYPTIEYYGYDIESGCMRLTDETKSVFFQEGEVKTTKKYHYDASKIHMKPVKIESTDSKFNTITEDVKYTEDMTLSGNAETARVRLLSENRVATPLEQIRKQGSAVDKTYTEYQIQNGLCQPFVVKTSTGGNPNYVTALTYNHYDNRGNLLQYTGRDGVPVSFAWGYNRQYPVAKVVGATFQEIKTALAQSSDDLTGIQSLTGNDLKNRLNQIRTHLNTTAKAGLNAQVSTYTYKPLVGMDSETDPNGITSTFEYDTFGRLIRILDNEGKVLKQFEYNYKK